MMKKEKIKVENIIINLTRKNIKHMYLRVTPPNGEVTLSTPYFISNKEIINFIKLKKEWILKKQTIILNNAIKPKLKYITGEKHLLWGKKYYLQLISNENVKEAFTNKNTIYLPTTKRSSVKSRENILNKFYKKQLESKIPNVLEECAKIVGKRPKEIKTRKMKNWGNCRMPDEIITLNIKLAKKDPICLKYVLIHELCHLIEFNHSAKFKKLMDKYCPNWREIKKKLNE